MAFWNRKRALGKAKETWKIIYNKCTIQIHNVNNRINWGVG
jgi:hypothetical protein